MLKNTNDETVTPKGMAQQVLLDAILAKIEFIDEDILLRDATVRENRLVLEQSVKLAKRIAKLLGFDPETILT